MHSKAVGKRISWTNCALLALLDVREVLDLLRKCGEQAVFVLGHRGYISDLDSRATLRRGSSHCMRGIRSSPLS